MAKCLFANRTAMQIYGPMVEIPPHFEKDSLVYAIDDTEEFGSGELDTTKFYVQTIPGLAKDILEKYQGPRKEHIIKTLPKVALRNQRLAAHVVRQAINDRATKALARFAWDSVSGALIDTENKDNGQLQ